MKNLLILVFLFSLSHAEAIEPVVINGIFKDAILFLTLFATMSVISIVITRKNAKNYEQEVPLQERKDAAREKRLVGMYLNSSRTKMAGTAAILLDLSLLLKENSINQEEFQILKLNLNTNMNT